MSVQGRTPRRETRPLSVRFRSNDCQTPSGVANSFQFQGQQFDTASGDYYLRARYYDQSNGRFISQDPFGGRDEDPISLHRYLYAADDPVGFADPAGTNTFSLIGIRVGQIIGLDFLANGLPGTRFSNRAISTILGIAGLSRLRPDLTDAANHTVFEIKPDNPAAEAAGLIQNAGYITLLNFFSNIAGNGTPWRAGSFNDYYYMPITITGLPGGYTAVVLPTLPGGLILYSLFNTADPQYQLALNQAQAAVRTIIGLGLAGTQIGNTPGITVSPAGVAVVATGAAAVAASYALTTESAADAFVAIGNLVRFRVAAAYAFE